MKGCRDAVYRIKLDFFKNTTKPVRIHRNAKDEAQTAEQEFTG